MNKRFGIKETAEIFGVSTNKLRFYEKKGLIKGRREENNYRYYTEVEIQKIQTILTYRQLNFSIEDIREIFKENEKSSIINHLDKQWKIVNDEMSRLRLLKDSIEVLMDSVYEKKENGECADIIIETAEKLKANQEIKDSWRDRWNFNHWAEGYDESVRRDMGVTGIYKNYGTVLEKTYETAVENVEEAEACRVLDIGVGTGNLSEFFIKNGYDIIGIDQSRDMMNQAKNKFPGLRLRIGEFLKIPYENKRFDRIVSTYAFHHLDSQEKVVALKEMLRVLKEDGRIIIGDMMFENEAKKQEIYKTLSKDGIEEVEDEFYGDIEVLSEMVKDMGRELTSQKIDRFMHVITIK